MTGRTAAEERRTMEEKELSAAETYSQMFDPYLDNPPYVPEDHAALYFARVNVFVDGSCVGFSHRAHHVRLEELRNDRFLLAICRDYPEGKQLGFAEKEECEKWRVFTCVYGSLGPPCF